MTATLLLPALAVAAVTALGLVTFPTLAEVDLAMLYLVAIALASLRGRLPALVAASLAVAAFDFCFVPPRFTFVIADPRHGITFAVMVATGLAIATLAERARRHDAAARDARGRAEREELRSAILSSVSHDLRTPLAVILGGATSLRDDGDRLGPEARAELLDTVITESARLERVLGNLLAMTRVETGLQPRREWVPVEELVGSALRRAGVDGPDVATLELEPELSLSVDPVLFEQVLINLLDNAIRHGRPPIRIVARGHDGGAEVVVEDHGPGVPVDARALVFDKFARAGASRGVGLGLAIARGVVAAHGGTIEVEAAASGGARFVIRLPSAPAPVPLEPTPSAPTAPTAPPVTEREPDHA